MEKMKHYCHVKFTPNILSSAWELIWNTLEKKERDSYRNFLRVDLGSTTWGHDSIDEFYADYRKPCDRATCNRETYQYSVNLRFNGKCTDVTVRSPLRSQIESIFEIFEVNESSCRIEVPSEEQNKICVFIGHGRNNAWRDLKDHLHEQHAYDVEAYEIGARAGHAIRDILEDMLAKSTFAILVLTGEDLDAEGNLRARENVVHELGLFQGRLGFSRAITAFYSKMEPVSFQIYIAYHYCPE